MLMTKNPDPAAALYKEMRTIVEKCRSLTWASDEWNAHIARYNELAAMWSNARQDNMVENMKHVRIG